MSISCFRFTCRPVNDKVLSYYKIALITTRHAVYTLSQYEYRQF